MRCLPDPRGHDTPSDLHPLLPCAGRMLAMPVTLRNQYAG